MRTPATPRLLPALRGSQCQPRGRERRRTGANLAQRSKGSGHRSRLPFALFHRRSAFSRSPNYEGWVDTVPYGCWRRETFDQIGLFDEDLVRNQDDEFNLRLIRAGGTHLADPAIVSWYSPRAELARCSTSTFSTASGRSR